MPRIRSIKPEFFRSRSLSRCTRDARLTFAGLWCEADDAGNGIADPRILAGSIWPLDDEITHGVVEAHLAELVSTAHVDLYHVDGERYFHIRSWERHQPPSTRRGEGKYPGPSAADVAPTSESAAPVVVKDSAQREIPHEDTSTPRDLAPVVVLGQGSGVRGQGSGVAPPEAPPQRSGRPPDRLWDAVMDACGVDEIPESARGAYNKALKALRDVGANPHDVPVRSAVFRDRWPDASLTPTSLARRWGECGPNNRPGQQQQVRMPKGADAVARAVQRARGGAS